FLVAFPFGEEEAGQKVIQDFRPFFFCQDGDDAAPHPADDLHEGIARMSGAEGKIFRPGDAKFAHHGFHSRPQSSDYHMSGQALPTGPIPRRGWHGELCYNEKNAEGVRRLTWKRNNTAKDMSAAMTVGGCPIPRK